MIHPLIFLKFRMQRAMPDGRITAFRTVVIMLLTFVVVMIRCWCFVVFRLGFLCMFWLALVVMLVNGAHMRVFLNDFWHVNFDVNTVIKIYTEFFY